MAKSPLIGKMKDRAVASENVIELPSMSVEVKYESSNTGGKIELETIKYRNGDIAQGKPKINRDRDVIKIATYFHKANASKQNTTLYCLYKSLRYLLKVNDIDDVDPFSKAGLINLSRHLRTQVQLFNPLKNLWNYKDGDQLGLKEGVANGTLNFALQVMKEILGKKNTDLWLEKEKKFNSAGGLESHEAYDSVELNLSVRRLTLYFTQLATKLIEFKRSGDTEDYIKVSVDGSDWIVPVTVDVRMKLMALSTASKDTAVCMVLAFNQAMATAYHLLSYFTAFNTTSLFGIRKPLIITESKAEEWYRLDAFKGRSSSNVESFLGGKMHKKALTFIKLLGSLSDAYNEEQHAFLLYTLTNINTPVPLSSHCIHKSKISEALHLTVRKKDQCVKHLCQIYDNLINSYHGFTYTFPIYVVKENQLEIREKKSITGIVNRISTIAFAILDAVKLEENVSLIGIVLPIGMVFKIILKIPAEIIASNKSGKLIGSTVFGSRKCFTVRSGVASVVFLPFGARTGESQEQDRDKHIHFFHLVVF